MIKKIIIITVFFCCIVLFTATAEANDGTTYIDVDLLYSGQQTKVSDYWYDDTQGSYIQSMKILYNDGTELTFTVEPGNTGVTLNNGTSIKGEGFYYNTNGEKVEVYNQYYIGAQGYPSGAAHTSVQAQYIGGSSGNKIKVYFSAPYHISNSGGTGNDTMIRSANGFYFGPDATDIKQMYFPGPNIMFYFGEMPQEDDRDLSTEFDLEMAIDEATGMITGKATNNNFWGFLQPVWDFIDNVLDFLAECWKTLENLLIDLFVPADETLEKFENIEFPNYLAFLEDNFTAIDSNYDPKNTNYGTFYTAKIGVDELINSQHAIFGNKNAFGGNEQQRPIEFLRRITTFIYQIYLAIISIHLIKKLASFSF